MKFLVILSVALACAAAENESKAEILESSNQINPDNSYQYYYITQNGIRAHEEGNLKNTGNDHLSIEVQGGYQYPSPDGQIIDLSYIANEYGFQPRAKHLPVGPSNYEEIKIL